LQATEISKLRHSWS